MSFASSAVLAASPLVVLLGLMLGLRWSTARAALVALVVTLVVALAAFDYGADELGHARAITGAVAEAVFAAFTIAWILWPAVAIYHLQRGPAEGTGPIDVLQRAIRRVSGEPMIVALLVAWFFALFLEGAAGFGTPVALVAPFLVAAGFQPVTALALALVGHAAGVSFGALGTPLFALETVSGLDALVVSRATAIYAALLGWMLPLAMLASIRREAVAKGGTTPRTRFGWGVVAAALFFVPYLVIAWWVGPELPALGGGLAGGVGFAVLWQRRGERAAQDPGARVDTRHVLVAAAPYLCVVALVLITRLIPPVREAIAFAWTWDLFDRFEGRLQPLAHPGTLLFASLLVGAAVQRSSPRSVIAALGGAARRLAPVVLALIGVLAVSRLMVHAQMIDTLAIAAARAAGPIWPLLAPFVGVLGTFVTGSATASNLLFTDFQGAAADQTGLGAARAMGAQGFGAAAGNMIAPMNVLAGAATVGLVGRESEIMRRTLGICMLYTLCGGLLTWLLHGLGV